MVYVTEMTRFFASLSMTILLEPGGVKRLFAARKYF